MLKITDSYNLKDIYDFQLSFKTPYFFDVGFDTWKRSFEEDTDGEGRELFKELFEKGVTRFDTDTAFDNTVARYYYEKNDFIREGVTRSYFTKLVI